ncbi:MAG: hypothetical protein QOD55_696 [Solirubrobacteraceae bacterium]|nr:hypothetical protein [Solirubrobacteraceae bacterium]
MFERFRKSRGNEGSVATHERDAELAEARLASEEELRAESPRTDDDPRFGRHETAGERDRGIVVDAPHSTARDGSVQSDENAGTASDQDDLDDRGRTRGDDLRDDRGRMRGDDRFRSRDAGADDRPLSREAAIEDERMAAERDTREAANDDEPTAADRGTREAANDDERTAADRDKGRGAGAAAGGAVAAAGAAAAGRAGRDDDAPATREHTRDDERAIAGERGAAHDRETADRRTMAHERAMDDRATGRDRDAGDDRGDGIRRHAPVLATEQLATVRERQRDRFGGIQWGSDFFGWLCAIGLASLLTAILVGAGVALGLSTTDAANADTAQTIGLGGGIALLVVLAVSWFCGGYVAGRMARFDGARQGIGVWLWTILAALVVAGLAAIGGSEFDIFQRLNLPRIAIGGDTLTAGGAITGAVAIVVTLLFAVIGGIVGERFHKRVDRVATDEFVVER